LLSAEVTQPRRFATRGRWRHAPCFGAVVQSPAASPVVSIITPAHNSAAYLRESVDSAIAQSFTDFELLIIDDGSTDGTLALARRLADRDERLRVLARPNRGGVSAARNLGMREARGAYFALLDSDDVWHPTFLAAQMEILNRLPGVDVVSGNAYNLGGGLDGQTLSSVGSDRRPIRLIDMLEHEDAVCIMSVLRRGVYETIGGFDETMNYSEDYDFWIRAALAGFRFVQNPVPLAHYRRRPDSASSDEIAMLQGIVTVLRRARARCANLPDEVAAIDLQIVRFEEQQLLTRAKANLLCREFASAAHEFDVLFRLRPSFVNGVMARVSRHVPSVLLWAYRTKSAIRSGRVGSGAPSW
jgi:hypothetical protein